MKLRDITSGIFKRRSKHWRAKRKEFLSKNPACAICGSLKKLEVHHIKPFHVFPELELVDSNLIVLCESGEHGFNCHLFFGHFANYRNSNASIPEQIEYYKKMLNWIRIYK